MSSDVEALRSLPNVLLLNIAHSRAVSPAKTFTADIHQYIHRIILSSRAAAAAANAAAEDDACINHVRIMKGAHSFIHFVSLLATNVKRIR